MNLVIEQRPRTITSNFVHQQSNDVNNHYSTSPLRLNFKRQNTNLQAKIHSNILMSNEENNSIASNQRLKRSIPANSSRRPSSPAFNGKKQQQQQQSTKRSAIIDNNNNDLTSNIDENSTTKRFKQDDLNHSSTTKVDASVETTSIGLATEPDQLGPCEPGTSVVLEGIVWNETDSGVLVVNVTWRGKTYVGTLLDSTKQDWACPRLTCDSPTSDYDPRSSSKTSRGKRYNNNNNHTNNSRSSCQQIISNHSTTTTTTTTSDDRKLRNNIKTRQSKRTNPNNFDDNQANNSSPLTSPYPTNSTFFPNNTTNSETQLISCPESSCHKQFVSTTALNYHLSHAHKKTEPPPPITTTTTTTIPPANTTRDEQDVAHILANVADYVRRPSPRSSPDHHQRQTTLTWPCPTISSNLVLSSSLNNNEQTIIPNATRTNIELDETKPTVKQADHFLLEIKDEQDDNKKTIKIPTPPPSSSLVQINLAPTIQPPPVSTSPAYSDISDEEPNPTATNDNQQISPSTVNLLNDQTVLPGNASWPSPMLLQQYGSFIQHGLNSKTNSNSSHNTDDSTVKNILDSRRSSTTQSSIPSPSTNDPLTLYHYHSNGITNDAKISPTILNSLTSPNENLLNPSSSSTINPSR